MRCAYVFMAMLICLTSTVLQSSMILPPDNSTNPAIALPVNEIKISAPISSVSKTVSPLSSKSSIDIGNPLSYSSVSRTVSSSSPDPRMPTSDNCVYSFENAASGKYATSTDNSLYAETYQNIYQTFNNISMAQHFRLKDAGDGYFYIIPLEYNGSEGRMMCAKLPDHIGFVENVFYSEYTNTSEYEFRWRIEFIETPSNRIDCFAFFLGDSNYALTSMTNDNGSHDQSGTNPIQPYYLKGNICVASYGFVENYNISNYTFTENH